VDRQYFKFNIPRYFITSGAMGTMGFGMGAASALLRIGQKAHGVLSRRTAAST
jgi:hypothetical protein